jgi:hypothetical protein
VTQVVIDAQSPSIATRPVVVPKGPREAVVNQCLCRLLDRTPSERSEDKLVFLINDQPVELFLRNACSYKNARAVPLPSGWALMMRAIKCLKGIRWMPWR